ncbi:hypothetical protein Daus18300_014383, partial [Diaporthe australafricana]
MSSAILPRSTSDGNGVIGGILDLPVEIRRMIANHLADDPLGFMTNPTPEASRDLRNLSLVSRAFASFAAESLYRYVNIPDLRALALFNRTFFSDPREWAKLVRHLRISIFFCPVGDSQRGIDSLFALLSSTESLQTLSLELGECTTCWRVTTAASFATEGAN